MRLGIPLAVTLAAVGLALPLVGCSSADEGDTPATRHDGASATVRPKPDAGEVPGLDPAFFDPDLARDPLFARHDPDPTKVDVDKLRALLAEAEATHSTSAVIAYDDVIIAEKYFGGAGGPASVQSITKTVVGLAIGALIQDGAIASIDTPVSTYYPEWATGAKAKVTLRHLLTMSAGFAQSVDDHLFDGDTLAYARAAPIDAAQLGSFAYSNTDVMLFAGIIAQAAHTSADAFVKRRFFEPLGITDFRWDSDAKGNVQTPGGLFLSPRDLLRLGRLVRGQGAWSGKALVPPSWMLATTTREAKDFPCYGYLTWLIEDGCSPSQGITGTVGPELGALADGYGGQYIAVAQEPHVIGVRTHDVDGDPAALLADLFDSFGTQVTQLPR